MSTRSKKNEGLSSKDADEEDTGSFIRQERENERRSKKNEWLSSKDTEEEETGSLIRQERENEQ